MVVVYHAHIDIQTPTNIYIFANIQTYNILILVVRLS